jgi:hypothetical protein
MTAMFRKVGLNQLATEERGGTSHGDREKYEFYCHFLFHRASQK